MDKEKIDKKDHILDVAERVFADLGYEGASTRLISGEAGVNMAMLNYYFGSKEGLFIAIFERKILFFQNLLQHLGSDETTSAWEKVEKYVDLYGDRVVNNNCFQKLLYQEMASPRRNTLTDKLTDMMMVNLNEFRRIINEGIQNGEFKKDIDSDMVTATIYGTKNFIINTPHVSSMMLDHDIQDEKFLEKELKPRLKSYLKKLLKAYLLEEHDNTIK
jgi:TetR/AcrR family transcriptional regulator